MFRLFRNRRQPKDQVGELLSAHLDGALTPDEQAELETQLAREPELQGRLEGLRLTTEALADLPQVEAPRNFILSPAMVAVPTAPAAPRRRPGWLALGWATTAATLLLIIVLAGDILVVAPPTRQATPVVVAMLTDEPQPAPREVNISELTPESEEQLAAPPPQQTVTEKEIAPAAAPAEEAEAIVEQPVAQAPLAPADNSTEDDLLAGTASQTPELRAMGTAPADGAAPVGESQPAPAQLDIAETSSASVAVERTDKQQTATLTTEKRDAATPTVQPRQETPTATIAPTPTPISGAPLWLRGLELVLGLSVIVLAAATWIARRRKWDAD